MAPPEMASLNWEDLNLAEIQHAARRIGWNRDCFLGVEENLRRMRDRFSSPSRNIQHVCSGRNLFFLPCAIGCLDEL